MNDDEMKFDISPMYQMKLVKEVSDKITEIFPVYKEAKFYISKWHRNDDYYENFSIVLQENGNIDLAATLHSMDANLVLKIAIDLGVDTPDFIPSVPTFRNTLKSDYKTAYSTFQKAYKQVESDPSLAVGLANSTMESIIKEILKDERISSKINGNETLYKLITIIIKEFKQIGDDVPSEIKTIGNSLITICQSIEKLRSEKTDFHGKQDGDYLLNDKIYAALSINAITTVGLFLDKFYKEHLPPPSNDLEDLPF